MAEKFRFARFLRYLTQILLVAGGALLSAFAYALFQVPFDLAAGGVSGISIIINHFSGLPVGILYLVMNVPLLILGFFHLGRWRFLWRTLVSVLVFSFGADLFTANLPHWLAQFPLTEDVLLNAIYGGILGGTGAGLIYRSGGTLGGTGIIGRILQRRTGVPLSQLFLYTDGLIIVTAGIVFGWETALYAFLTLFLAGVASDYVMEGPSVVRSATIITDKPDEVSRALIGGLNRGVSQWQIVGAYTGETHTMLSCTVYRSQVGDLKRLVAESDRDAFVIIGTAQQALGYGFRPLKSH